MDVPLCEISNDLQPRLLIPCDRDNKARHRTLEVSLVPPSTGAGDLSGRRRDLLLLDLENGRQTRDTVARRGIMVSARTGDGAVGSRDGLLLTHAHALSVVVELCSVGSEE